MKRENLNSIAGQALIAASLLFVAGGAMAQALTGIAATKHNLGTTGTGANHLTAGQGTAEICVFCHTPHGSDTSAVVPLWNKKMNDPANYDTYDTLGTSTIDGQTADVGSVSLACLSCHDGSQAMDTVLNAPGSGGYDAAGARMNTDGNWTGSSTLTTGIAALGVDLTNDHPVGIQYGGGGITAAAPAAGTNDPDFETPTSAALNGTRVWWIENGDATGRQKDEIQLYTRTDTLDVNDVAIAGGAQPYVECASCHDPHTQNATFLRTSNAGSAVCLACHTK